MLLLLTSSIPLLPTQSYAKEILADNKDEIAYDTVKEQVRRGIGKGRTSPRQIPISQTHLLLHPNNSPPPTTCCWSNTGHCCRFVFV